LLYSPNDDIIYELDIAFTDSSEGATEYMWEFGDGYTSTEASPIHHFDKGGYFEVLLRVMNDYGCSSEMTKAVNIDNTFYFFMPNSFTPDGDGLNDVFLPSFSSIEEIREYEFQVVNRWGEIIFKTDDPKMAWVGNSRNGEFYTHNDLFTWNVHVSFNNLQVDKNYTGTVTVLR
jgi:gliding motility-associated-like protein